MPVTQLKKSKIAFLILFLSSVCFSDMEYVPNGSDSGKKILIQSKNVTKIELVKVLTHKTVLGVGGVIDDAPENLQVKILLNKNMFKSFINDFNKITLINTKVYMSGMCCELRIYERENIITTFKTNGNFFYDEKHNLLYEYPYEGEAIISYGDLIFKYWEIESGYERYIRIEK